MAFGDVIRSASSPSFYPQGVGGDANTIWHCDDNSERVYELSTTDFSVIRYASSPDSDPSGIGGDSNTIWHCDYYTDDIYELDTGAPAGRTTHNTRQTMNEQPGVFFQTIGVHT